MRRLATIALACAALAHLVAGCSCGTRTPPPGAGEDDWLVEETDALGHTLRLAAYPERVVSTAPSNTEIVLQLGCRDRLVGITRFYGYPALVEGIPHVGGYYDPSIETILALKPDLVLVARGVSKEILTKMRTFDLPVFCLDTRDLDGLYRDIATIGRLLGADEPAATLVEELKASIERVAARTRPLAGSQRPRVFWLGQERPLKTAGPGNMIHTLFELAGGANVAADATQLWPAYSLETLLVKDPQIIIADPQMLPKGETSSNDLLRRLRADPIWSKISAVKDGRVYLVPTDLIGQPTPRIVEGLNVLLKHFHPELLDEEAAGD